MANSTLIARIDRKESEAESFLIRSPAVGVIDRLPAEGVFINPLQTFMTLTVLGRRHAVQLPHGVRGWVTERFLDASWSPVDYDRPLLRISVAHAPDVAKEAAQGAGTAQEAEAGLLPVRTPSQGVFYRRPRPDSPPYVEVGSTVARGTVLGLVEVMKCFNQIAYGGPGLPEQGTVAKILVDDNEEVGHGQVLFLIRPA